MTHIPEPAEGSAVRYRHPEGILDGVMLWPDASRTWATFCHEYTIVGIAPPESFVAPPPAEPELGRVVMWNRKEGGFLCMRRGPSAWEMYGESWHWEGILMDAIPGTLRLVTDAEVLA